MAKLDKAASKTFEELQSPGAGGKDRASENPSSFVSFG
jgi:hypothetical protein